MAGILWIASYPKSGNTWVRTFLANLIAGGKEPLALDAVSDFAPGESNARWYRPYLHMVPGKAMEDLNDADLARLRPIVQKSIVQKNENNVPLKTHNFYGRINDVLTAEPSLSLAVIYIVRDPRDVAISGAHHFNFDIDRMIEMMGSPSALVRGYEAQVSEYLNSWSHHVTSWCDCFPRNRIILRYEDMLEKPVAVLGGMAAKKLGITDDEARIRRAVEFSSFKKMKALEERDGFRERPEHNQTFFRSGKSGGWREKLKPYQVKKIERDHRDVMKRFGYL